MYIKTLLLNLVILISIINLGCSKKSEDQNDSVIISTFEITLDTFIDSSITIELYKEFYLSTDKNLYSIGDTVKILFKIFLPPTSDAVLYHNIIFSSAEKLNIEIFKDSVLVYHYPKMLTFTPDTLELTSGNTLYFSHNWLQIDDDINQVDAGVYTIKANLLDDNSPIKETKVTIVN